MTAPFKESLYLDSAIISKCGLFYITITRGRIVTTVDELMEFNKLWAQNIKNIMGYDEYYLAIKVEDALRQLCTEPQQGTFVLTNEGIAIMLSEVQRYQKSKMTVHHFMSILDRMIKQNVQKAKAKQIDERMTTLKRQLNDAFGSEAFVSYNTDEPGERLAIKLLLIMAEIYNYKTYQNSPTESQIGELVRLISERENKFHELMIKTQNSDIFDSKKCLDIASQIRRDKISAYRTIYEHIIDILDITKIDKVD